MAGFTTQKGGFTSVTDIFLSIATDMVANGFALKFPTTLPQAPVAPASTPLFKATMEFTESGINMPWRIQLDASVKNIGSINVATSLQLPNDGTTAVLIDPKGTKAPYPVGMVNAKGTLPLLSADPTNVDFGQYYFVYRDGAQSTPVGAAAYPLSYRLTVTDRGVALAVWEDAGDADVVPAVSWLVVQRPVDHLTGVTFTTGHAPVFAVFGMSASTGKFVVREDDVFKPTVSVSASANSEDSRAILNVANQVSITEDNRYVITFPNGLNTPRYQYTQELDMMAYTSADVVSEFTNVPLTVYGETAPRVYKALRSLGGNSTGMRLLFLTNGGGAAAPL